MVRNARTFLESFEMLNSGKVRPNSDGIYFLDIRVNGKRIRPSLGTRNKRIADSRATAKLIELGGATEADLDNTKLYAFLDMCLAHTANEGNSVKHENNKKWIVGVFKSLVSEMPLKKFSKLNADKFFGALALRTKKRFDPKTEKFVQVPITARGKNLYRRVFVTMWNLGATWKMVNENPWAQIPKFRESAVKKRYLEDSEINRIIESVRNLYPHEEDFYRTLLGTGLRRSEARYMQQSDVKLQRNPPIIHLTETKFHKERKVPIVPAVYEILDRRKNLESPFCDMPSAETISEHYIEIRRAAGIHDTKLHDTRKRFITELVHLGVAPSTIAEWVGHESFEETMADYIALDTRSHAKIQTVGNYEEAVIIEPKEIVKIDKRKYHTDIPRDAYGKDTRKNHAKKKKV